MDLKNIFLVISTLAALTAPIIGIYAILKGNFRPQRMTRLLISIISFLFVGTLLAQNDKNGIYIAGAQLLGNVIIFLLAIKRGIGGTSKLDILVFILAIFSLLIWKTTNNPLLGLIMSILTDFIAFSPTLIKIWRQPHTEEWKFYLSDVVSSSFSILSIQSFSFANLVFPVYILLINSVSVFMIKLRGKTPTNRLNHHV